jgi:hypothetical protein
MNLDDVFVNKDAIAEAVEEVLEAKMDEFGFTIIEALLINVEQVPQLGLLQQSSALCFAAFYQVDPRRKGGLSLLRPIYVRNVLPKIGSAA